MTSVELEQIFNYVYHRLLQKGFRFPQRSTISEINNAYALAGKCLPDEIISRIEMFMQYGFQSRPLADAQAILNFLGGNANNPIALATFDRNFPPPELEIGEVVLYDKFGNRLHLSENLRINIGDMDENLTAENAVIRKSDLDKAIKEHRHGGIALGINNTLGGDNGGSGSFVTGQYSTTVRAK